MSRQDLLYCPFCPYGSDAELCLIQHVEDVHPEDGAGPSNFENSPQKNPRVHPDTEKGRSDEDDYVECFCGEFCFLSG